MKELKSHNLAAIYKKYPIYSTAKNTEISPDFLVWKFCGKFVPFCAFPQNFHTRKSGEITAFFAVFVFLLNIVQFIGDNHIVIKKMHFLETMS